MKPVLLDTGVIVALLDRAQSFHQRAVAAVREVEAPLVTCEAVISESCYLLRRVKGAAEAVLENVAAGLFQIPFQLSAEASAIKQIMRKYRGQGIDFADACLICLAGQLTTGEILTLDNDFAIYRWGRMKPFNLLIELRPKR